MKQCQPIHLIYLDQETRKFKVSEEAKAFLSTIKERVGVISVAGKYRTGKSFLLNRVIINRRNQGFGVGPTINPCTKGLWLWGDTLQGEYQGEKLRVLLIDSEGIGAFDEDDNHDSKIFLLALLLSSYFIYNSMGTIDENAINSLSLIINLSKELQIKSEVVGESDPDEVAKYFPSFLWVVRDFSLRLHDSYGNQITPKEYLESAIQSQKGTSDQVETKNRIRRMIKHFFKDRDCFTLVRPVEEEKELQNLQSMADDQLRTEFITQVNQLRSKIYKRVKPKTLNSKFITGEMLLELANSYTEAINTGSVPNIQNAWSYVCQNECQRAIQDSIANYEYNMQKALEKAKEKTDENLIKIENRPLRDQAVVSFKSKAVGQDTQQFEQLLREGLSKKYKDIKLEFTKYCKTKALEFLDVDVQILKRNLTNNIYEDLEKFKEDLEKLKVKFLEYGPRFNGRIELIQELQISLLTKAADYLTISSKKELDIEAKRLKERLDQKEEERVKIKEDFSIEKERLHNRVKEAEAKLNESIRNEKVLEERVKMQIAEREKLEVLMNEKLKKKTIEKEQSILSQETTIKNLERTLKQREDEIFKKTAEFEKLQALLEQKLELVDKELIDVKSKLATKELEYKESNKELYQVKKENQQLQKQLNCKDQEKDDEIKLLKSEHEQQIKELQGTINQGITGNPQVSEDQQQQWNKERQQLNDQLKTVTEGLNQQKQFQEHLMKMLSYQKIGIGNNTQNSEIQKKVDKYKSKNKELMSLNQNLSQQIVQMQTKQQSLEKSVSGLKQFKFMVYHAIAIQCRSCNKLYPKNQYSSHLSECTKETERVSTMNAQQNINPITIQVTCSGQLDGEYIYDIKVEKNSQRWTLPKKMIDFKLFFDELYMQFPSYSHIIPFIQEDWLKQAGSYTNITFYTKEMTQKMQSNMEDLAGIPFIRENFIFKHFLEFEQNYHAQEDLYDPRRTIIQNQSTLHSYINSFAMIGQNSYRNSLLNPFNQALSGQKGQSQNKQKLQIEERRSVSPLYPSQQAKDFSNIDFKNNDSENGPQRHSMAQDNNYMIKELVEDEDYSSMASNNRISQLMQSTAGVSQNGGGSIRNSLQSQQIKKEVLPYQPSLFAQGSSNSNVQQQQNIECVEYQNCESDEGEPIVQVVPTVEEAMSVETVKIDRINTETFTEQSIVQVNSIPSMRQNSQQYNVEPLIINDYEDSFSKEVVHVNMSALQTQAQNDQIAQDETDFSKTKTNLISKFEKEAIPNALSQLQNQTPLSQASPSNIINIGNFRNVTQQYHSSSSSQASSARKHYQNSRYIAFDEDEV